MPGMCVCDVAFLTRRFGSGLLGMLSRVSLNSRITVSTPSRAQYQSWSQRGTGDCGVTPAAPLEARRIQNELNRLHALSLALATIQKVLQRHQVAPVVQQHRNKKRIFPVMPVPFQGIGSK